MKCMYYISICVNHAISVIVYIAINDTTSCYLNCVPQKLTYKLLIHSGLHIVPLDSMGSMLGVKGKDSDQRSDCMDAQAGLSLCWPHTHLFPFLHHSS